MPSSIPAVTVACVVFSMVFAFVLPIALGVAVCRRHKGCFRPILIGAFCFIVSVFVLEQLFHMAVFTLFPHLADNIIVAGLYGGLAAGVFEETARIIGLHFLCKNKKTTPATGFAYGVGHGGIEVIMLLGLSMLSTLVVMVTINSGNGESLLANSTGDAQTTLIANLSTLATTPSVTFLSGAIERVSALALHLALSMLIYLVIARRIGRWGYPLAIALHALVDFFAVFYQRGVITNIWVFELLIAVLVAGVAALVAWLYRKHPAPAETPAE